MRKLFGLFGLLSFAVSSSLASKWLYYEHYPWVYDHVSKDWWYLTGSSSGKIYKYQSSLGEWSEFGVITPQPIITMQGDKVVIDKIGNKYRYTNLEGIMTWTVSNNPSTSLRTNWQIYTNYHDHNRSWSIEGAFDDLPSENLSEINYEIDNLGNYIMKMPDLWGPPGYFWRTWEILSVENGIITIDSIPSPSQGSSPTYLFFSKEKATEFHESKLHEEWKRKYDEWILNPEPYGGVEVLNKIKNAMDNRVTELDLSDSNITDISTLRELLFLQSLKLEYNKISDLSPIHNLINLKTISLSESNFVDVSPLTNIQNLETLTGINFSKRQKEILETEMLDTKFTWQEISSESIFFDLNASVSLEMIKVKPGTFMMGQSGIQHQEPVHEVTLTKEFYLGKFEVTQAQYEAVMSGNNEGLSSTPSSTANIGANYPVNFLGWKEIQVFLELLNHQQSQHLPMGMSFRLPSEAQWEYAFRAGTSTPYYWGETFDSLNNYESTLFEVGQYPANPWGFFDMHGGVNEWTADWYSDYTDTPKTDPLGPPKGINKVLRGTNWSSNIPNNRGGQYPENKSFAWGFRLSLYELPEDLTNPELELLGPADFNHTIGEEWRDPWALAFDDYDGDLTSEIQVSGFVDINSTGSYVLNYQAEDRSGNISNTSRIVNVTEKTLQEGLFELNYSFPLNLIWVEPGTFIMGSPTSELGRRNDETQRTVTLINGFYLGKYEVTQDLYEAVMIGNEYDLSPTPSNWRNNPNRPVEKVSFDDVQKFFLVLNSKEEANIPEGWAYTLPNEEEWEYACRAGTNSVYWWGDEISYKSANFSESEYSLNNGYSQTQDVGQYCANPWGFFDMHGNVNEWTADLYDGVTGTNIDYRTVRGGSCTSKMYQLRSADRNYFNPSNRNSTIGFRIALKQVD